MSHASQSSYLELLRGNRNYRNLYAARLVSMLGDWISLIALLSLMDTAAEGNAWLMGVLVIMKMAPAGLLGPLAGVVADRFSRKTIMIASDLVRFVVVLGYFLAPFFPNHAVPLILVLSFLQATGAAFFDPALNAMLPTIVERRDLTTANALSAVTWSLTFTLGSLLGGLLTSWLGWKGVLVIDALSFLLSAAFLFQLPRQKQRERKPVEGWRQMLGITDLFEGFGYIKNDPRVTYILLIKTGMMTGGSMLLVLTLYGQRLYTMGDPDTAVGVFLATRAVGTALGPIIGRRIVGGNVENMRRLCVYGMMGGGLFYIAFALMNHLWLVLFFVFLAHIFASCCWVFSTVILQRLAPDEFAGRIFAVELASATLMIAVSNHFMGDFIESGLISLKLSPAVLGTSVFLSGCAFLLWGRSSKVRGKFNLNNAEN